MFCKLMLGILVIMSLPVVAVEPDGGSFDRIVSGPKEGQYKLTFTFGEVVMLGFPVGVKVDDVKDAKVTLLDFDGDSFATLAALHYVLTERVATELWEKKINWSNWKDKEVQDWDKIKTVYLSLIKTAKDKDSNFPAGVIDRLKQKPTYVDLNEVGDWIAKNLGKRQYSLEIDMSGQRSTIPKKDQKLNGSNPIAKVLTQRSFVLPSKSWEREKLFLFPDLGELTKKK